MSIENKPKQVIVIRRDLKMRRGKEIAQGSHASMAFLAKAVTNAANDSDIFESASAWWKLSEPARDWLEGKFTKVTCQVDTEVELLDVYQKALDAGLEAHLITDQGATEFHGVPTNTCIAIGPDYSDRIDAVTRHLKLY
jgi:PTH2 family peptidyl-tRNA hydrolase